MPNDVQNSSPVGKLRAEPWVVVFVGVLPSFPLPLAHFGVTKLTEIPSAEKKKKKFGTTLAWPNVSARLVALLLVVRGDTWFSFSLNFIFGLFMLHAYNP